MTKVRNIQSVSYQPVESCDTLQQGIDSRINAAAIEFDRSLNHSSPLSSVIVKEEEIQVSIDDAIDLLGFGRFQCEVLCATGLSYAADGIQVILLSFLTPVLQEQWELNNNETASISSTLFAGAFFGTLLWGPLADSLGRRLVFLLATIVITIASFGMSFMSSFGGILVSVFGIGFGVGGLTIPFDILAEFLPTNRRGQKLLSINYAWTVGVLYVVAGAYMFLNTQISPSWQQFTRWCAIPCLLSLIIGYFVIPESPRWLASKGRLDEAMNILRRAAITNSMQGSLFSDKMILKQEPEERHAKLTELLYPQWRNITLRLWGAWFTMSFGYFGTLILTTRIFSTSDDDSSVDAKFDFSAIFISSLAEFIGTTVAIVVIDQFGRIQSQVISFLTAGFFLFTFCVLAQWNAERWVLLLVAFISRIFEMAATCILWVATAEILSTEIRAAGHSSSNAFARIGAIFCPLLVQSTTSLIQVGIVMCAIHSFTAFCVSRLPETKGRIIGFGYTT